MQAGEPSRDPHAHEAEPTLTPERSLAWDFGKLPLSPTEPSSAPDASAPLLGNIQRKLAIGSVDDPLEHEADRVADLVMRVPDPDIAVTSAPRQVSRKCAECEEEDKQKLQMKPAAASQSQTVSAPPIVHDVLRSPGQPLEKAARASLEPRFGHDFSQLRIHADAKAAESARAVAAQAYTVGGDIVFGAGRYTPGTESGRRLLAHELAHTIQQGAARGPDRSSAQLLQRDDDGSNAVDPDQEYQAAVQSGDWQAAAEWLNGFNHEDIQARLAKLSQDQITSLHQGALDNPRVGPQSQIAQLTEPGTPLASTPPPAASTPPPAAEATPPASPPAAAPGVDTGPAAAVPAQAQQGPDPNSLAYKQGYDDAKNGRPSQPAAVLNEDAIADYNAGYADGSAPGPTVAPTPPTDASQPAAQPGPGAPTATTPEDQAVRDRQVACVVRLGGCPSSRDGGIPSTDDIQNYNQQCKEKEGTQYTGTDITPTDDECKNPPQAPPSTGDQQGGWTTGEKVAVTIFAVVGALLVIGAVVAIVTASGGTLAPLALAIITALTPVGEAAGGAALGAEALGGATMALEVTSTSAAAAAASAPVVATGVLGTTAPAAAVVAAAPAVAPAAVASIAVAESSSAAAATAAALGIGASVTLGSDQTSDKKDEEDNSPCKSFPSAIPIRWPAPLWHFDPAGINDPGEHDTTFDLPAKNLLVKAGSTFYDDTRPEIGRYLSRIAGPPFYLTPPLGFPVHHKWPLFLGGPGNAERAEGEYDPDGGILAPPNLVVMSPGAHAAWHSYLRLQPEGPRPGLGPANSTPDGTQFCIVNGLD